MIDKQTLKVMLFLLGAVPVCVLLGKLFFQNWTGFAQALGSVLDFSFLSSFERDWQRFKLWTFVGLCVLFAYAGYDVLDEPVLDPLADTLCKMPLRWLH